MAIEFKIKDFFYPFSILRLRSFLERSQWFSEDELKAYQLERLKLIFRHAYKNVPYYRNLFDNLKLDLQNFTSLDDLKIIPVLDKQTLRNNFTTLTAKNAFQFNPKLCRTSGTSGKPVEFYQDKSSNILEFCYYWRYWSWAGYRIGTSFAEFTLNHFLNNNIKDIASYSSLMKRLMLNPAQLSYENIDRFVLLMKKYRPSYLKGAPATIYAFAYLLEKKGYSDVKLQAIFTTGEPLLLPQKKMIEDTFHCKIFDSYGHMERTVAVCQCPVGRYHINSDYGILEIEKDERLSTSGTIVGRVIGTSLYNFAMPLLRYRVDDVVEVRKDSVRCECGRGFPLCEKIIGRAQDIIITPDGRFLSNVFILFDILKGVLWAQIIQEDTFNLRIKIVKGSNFSVENEREFKRQLRTLTGEGMKIEMEYLPLHMLEALSSQKYKPVISNQFREIQNGYFER